jgi:hypothetical protein
MSLRLIKPGLSAAGRVHPKTGQPIEPLYVRKDGSAVWPVLGAASDDPDDPAFQDGETDDADDDAEDDEDDEEDEKPSSKKSSKKSKDDDEDDDEDEDDKDAKLTRPERQAARYRVKLREAEAANRQMAERLRKLEDKDKKPDEIVSRDLQEARTKAEELTEKTRAMSLELAFFKSNTVDWVDPADALRLVDLDDVEVDDDGTVNAKALRVALRDLARRKPHLVKKPKQSSGESDDGDEEQGSGRRSAGSMNGRRKGSGAAGKTREELAKRFPVLGR